MKKYVLSVVAGVAMSASAFAADLPAKAPKVVAAPASPWEIALGAAVVSDYNFRGISQSNRGISFWGYIEPRYNIAKDVQIYVGSAFETIRFPNNANVEVDFYGGIRPTFGPIAFDFGIWYYYYPGGNTFTGVFPSCSNINTPALFCNAIKSNVSFLEFYGKATWTVNDSLSFGANLFYSPSWLNSGAPGTYGSLTAKVTAPAGMLAKDWGAYVSGEIGHYWFGTTDAFYGTIKLPEYTTWNVGVGVTYQIFTVDLRYYNTDLSRANCNVLTSDHTATFNVAAISAINNGGESKWCGDAIILKLAVDTTIK